MRKTVCICDICKKEFEESKFKNLSGYDICTGCQIMIITKVINDKLINLTPWCKVCKGVGRTKECTGYDYDRNQYEWKDCKACKLEVKS